MLRLLKELIFTREFGFNIRYYLFFFLSLGLISLIFHTKLVQITQEYKEYRSLRETYYPPLNSSTLEPDLKLKLLGNLLKETYIGTWKSPASSFDNNLNKTGDIEIIFQIVQWNKNLYGFYYNYYIILFEGKYNNHSITITNSFPFSFEEDYPILLYDNTSEIGTFKNIIKSSVNEYNYLSLKHHRYLETNVTMTFNTNINKRYINASQIEGSILFNNTNYYFDLMQLNPSIYQSIYWFTSWLSIIGFLQAVLFQYMKTEFDIYPNKALKVYNHCDAYSIVLTLLE